MELLTIHRWYLFHPLSLVIHPLQHKENRKALKAKGIPNQKMMKKKKIILLLARRLPLLLLIDLATLAHILKEEYLDH